MAFKDGDFLEVEYSAWTAADNGLIATTDEKKAKEASIFDEHVKYGSVLVVIGSNSVVKGLDKSLRDMNASEMKKITLKPDEAFGERMPDLVRVMPLADFKRRDINPYPGMQVEIDNMTVVVKSINSGRVVIDANHPYAGQEITYEVKILKELKDPAEKIKALGRNYNAEPTSADMKDKTIRMGFGNDVKKNADYFVGKANLIASTFTYFKDVGKIDVEEEDPKTKGRGERGGNFRISDLDAEKNGAIKP